MHPLFRQATFLKGVAQIPQLPLDEGAEVAFAGRSNAGKSSAVNVLTGINTLARTSKTPGRTQQINFFQIGDGRRLVDLPGYGFAKVSAKAQAQWLDTIEAYLSTRRCLAGVILLMDSRRPFTPLDLQFAAWATGNGVRLHALLTKSDKLSRSAAARALAEARRQTTEHGLGCSVQLFSATKRSGTEEAQQCLSAWLGLE